VGSSPTINPFLARRRFSGHGSISEWTVANGHTKTGHHYSYILSVKNIPMLIGWVFLPEEVFRE